MPVFVAVTRTGVDDFQSLEEDEIQLPVVEVTAQYDENLPPDLTGVALRKLGIQTGAQALARA